MRKKKSRRTRPAPAVKRRRRAKLDPVEMLLRRLPPDNRDEPTKLKASTDLMEKVLGPGTFGWDLAHIDEILEADRNRKIQERARDELDLKAAMKALINQASKKSPLTDEIWQAHLATYEIDLLKHPERSGQWRANRIMLDYPGIATSKDRVNARLRAMKPTK
jgi:hypothetical protein